MATGFPTTLDSLTNPSSGNTLNSPSHSTQHANSNDAIEALEAKVGVDSSAVTTSLDYKVRVGNPIGEIAMWSTNTPPTGWLLCDGIPKDRNTYSALHSLMQAAGYPYGAGNGSSTFGIPNLQGRFPVGKDASAEFDVLGETGGGKTNALGVSNLPAHNHSVTDNGHGHGITEPNSGQGHVHYGPNGSQFTVQNINSAGGSVSTSTGPHTAYNHPNTAYATTGISIVSQSTGVTVPTSGGNGTATGNAFNILPPYFAINFIIRF